MMTKYIVKQKAISALINEANTHSNPVKKAYTRAAAIVEQIAADEVQSANQWICVKDKQPKCIHGSSDSVLVHRDNGECEVAYLVYDNDDGFYWYTQDERTAFEFEEVTHWMPLPESPKDGDAK